MSRSLELPRQNSPSAASPAARYEKDYFAWTQWQVEALRAGRKDELDLENLAEEVGDLGISVRRAIASRLHVLVLHLVKWGYQPTARSSSWKGSIVEQRKAIREELRDSPSLKSYPASVLDDQYASARLKAAGETGLPETAFPEVCPYTIEQILDPDFYPEAEG